jgi:hypothetical protein
MKKFGLLLLYEIVFCGCGVCQQELTKDDVYYAKEITVYGVDFSNAVIIHESEEHIAMLENDYYFTINNLFFLQKFNDLKKVMKNKLKGNEEFTQERNKNLEKKYTIYDLSIIQKIISEYNTPEKEGIGLVFIVKSLDKPNKKVELFPTFFNIETKQVIWTFKVEGRGGKYGLEIYWSEKMVNAIDNFIEAYSSEFSYE